MVLLAYGAWPPLELAGAEGIAGVLPGQLEQTKALRRPFVAGNKVAVQVGWRRRLEDVEVEELRTWITRTMITTRGRAADF